MTEIRSVCFRVDASLKIGIGHVMRCLTLADALRDHGSQCSFVCRPHQGNLLEMIAHRGHNSLALPALTEGEKSNRSCTVHEDWLGTDWTRDAQDTKQALYANFGGEPIDLLVVDHYALDEFWEEALRSQARSIMVIDDLADRPHACDLLLDQNLGRKAEDYRRLLQGKTLTLIGPQYALLRPEFAAMRAKSLARRSSNPQLRRLLITMGGVDKDNATGQVLNALAACALSANLHITVVMGPHAPWLVQVQAQAANMPWYTEVLVGVNNMAELMADSDLAISAAGSTSWERCCLGLPTFMLILAANQSEAARAIAATQSAWILEQDENLSEGLANFFTKLNTPSVLTKVSDAASCLCDGGGVGRVVTLLGNLRK